MREWIKVLCFLVIGSFFIYIIGSRVQSGGEKTGENDASLVIYTQHPTEFMTPIVREYEARTGVEVEVVRGGSGELLERIRNEKEAPTADVLWGGSLYTVKPYAELFEDYHTENEPYVQAQFRNVEGNLTRFTDVPSVIMVNTDLLGDRTIEGYEDLLNPDTLSAAIYEEIYRVNQQNRCSSQLYLIDSNGELL